jgi:hypothetical protein
VVPFGRLRASKSTRPDHSFQSDTQCSSHFFHSVASNRPGSQIIQILPNSMSVGLLCRTIVLPFRLFQTGSP